VRLRDSWQVLLGIFAVATFLEAAFFGQLFSLIPLHLARLGVPAAELPERVGQMYGLTGLIGIPFLPFWGALADRYARRPVIVRSFLAHVAAAATMALAPNVIVFTVGYAVTALAFGNTGLMTATLAERTPAGRSGFAITTMNSAAPVGASLGPIVAGPVFDAYGLQPILWANGAVMLLIVALMSFGYRDPYRGRPGRPLLAMAVDGVGLLVGSPRIRALFTALFVLMAGWLAAFAFLPLAVADVYRGSNVGTAVGLVSGASGLAALAFGPAIGAMADRWGHWRVLYVAIALAVVLWPFELVMPEIVSFGALWALVGGIRSGAFGLSFSVMSSSVAAAHRGRVMAFAFLPVNLGVALGPLIASPVARANVFLVFPLASAITLVGLFVLVWAQRQRVPEAAPAVA
jgi:DHA1 family multidrug resistance protein-like MFS transporter